MSAAVPLQGLLHIDQANVRFVKQARGLQRLARLFLLQLLRRQIAQRAVDERQKLLGGVRVASLNGRQNAGNIAHHI